MNASTTRIRAVLFDLDGTLVDTAPDLVGCVQDVMRARGRPPAPFETLRPYVSRGVRGLLSAAYGAGILRSAEYPTLQDHCLELYSTRLADQSQLFPGLREVLNELARIDMRWGVVTNKPEYLTRPLLKALDLDSECAVTVGGDTTAQSKPHPEPMLHAARQLQVDPAHCVMLGDDPRDVQAAHAANMSGLAVAWGYFPPGEDMNAWGADAILESPESLLTWLASQGVSIGAGAASPRAA